MLVIFVMEWMGKKFYDFSTSSRKLLGCNDFFESMGLNKKIIETKYLKVLKIHIKKALQYLTEEQTFQTKKI